MVVESQIDGDFSGFDNDILFPLQNGQYWIQTNYKHWYKKLHNPEIKIYKYNGTNYLMVDGQTEFIDVDQVMDVIEDIIINDFSGWSGDTIFELNNGQIWKQDEYSYRYHHAYRPKALIYSTGIGHKMIVEGESLRVVRIE